METKQITVTIPKCDAPFFTKMAQRMGWNMQAKKTKKKSGLEEALEDVRMGRVYGPFKSTEELWKFLDSDV